MLWNVFRNIHNIARTESKFWIAGVEEFDGVVLDVGVSPNNNCFAEMSATGWSSVDHCLDVSAVLVGFWACVYDKTGHATRWRLVRDTAVTIQANSRAQNVAMRWPGCSRSAALRPWR